MEGVNINHFPLKEKNNYNWTLYQTKKYESICIYIYYGENKNNYNDVINLEIICLIKANADDLKQIIKKCYLLISLKKYNYFIKNAKISISDDNNYLFIIIKKNLISLSLILESEKFIYLTNDFIKWVVYQIAFGLYILHSNNIIHHDIKLSNILVNSIGGIYINNFGSAIFKGENSYSYTLSYASPEYLIDSKIDEKIDMWGLGVIILELYSKRYIFKSESKNKRDQLNFIFSKLGIKDSYTDEDLKKELKDNKNILFNIEEIFSDKKIDIDKDAKNLLNNLITFSPKKRYTAKQVLESDYLKEFRGLDSLNIEKIEYSINYEDLIIKNKINNNKFNELIEKIKE